MENTLENHKIFRAQYLSQKVLRSQNGVYLQYLKVRHLMLKSLVDGTYLEVTPLDMISDDDAKEVGYCIRGINQKDRNFKNDIFCKEDGIVWAKRRGMRPTMNITECSSVIDYMRSKGYGVPFNGVSIEQQLEYGWIKLKTQ